MVDGRRPALIARPGEEGWAALCCAIQTPLEPIGESGIVGITVRVPRVREALIDAGSFPGPDLEPPDVIRGPDAPPAPPEVRPLRGRVDTVQLPSAILGETRRVSIYLPPDIAEGAKLPTIYMADGDAAGFASIAEASVRDGRSAPAIIVGITPGQGTARGCKAEPCDQRMLDYVIDHSLAQPFVETPFGRHLRYVTDEIIPYVERTCPASPRRQDRVTSGYSNGGAWALAAAERRPDVFGNVLAMSSGSKQAAADGALLKDARVYAGGGLFEGNFRTRSLAAADAARAAGADAIGRTVVSCHSRLMWNILFADGIAWLLPPKR